MNTPYLIVTWGDDPPTLVGPFGPFEMRPFRALMDNLTQVEVRAEPPVSPMAYAASVAQAITEAQGDITATHE